MAVTKVYDYLEGDKRLSARIDTVEAAIGGQAQIHFNTVTKLPEQGAPGVIYLLANKTGEGDAYDEYLWVDDTTGYERIGSTSVDMSNYALKKDTVLDTTLSRGRKSNTTVGKASLAFGYDTEASGYVSTAQGYRAAASNQGAVAEGGYTHASNMYSHAEGYYSKADGTYSHAEGRSTEASGQSSHAEGMTTSAAGDNAHAEGNGSVANGKASHAGGYTTKASGAATSVVGSCNIPEETFEPFVSGRTYNKGDKVTYGGYGYICIAETTQSSDSNIKKGDWKLIVRNSDDAVIVGNGTSDEERSNAATIAWDGTGKFAGDIYANYDFANGTGEKLATESYVNEHGGGGSSSDEYALKKDTVLDTTLSHGRASGSTVGQNSIAFGNNVTASGTNSAAFGSYAVASGMQSHAEGGGTTASGSQAHAEGAATVASGESSHAEGSQSRATGKYAHAEATGIAKGESSHAEGTSTTEGQWSHGEGDRTKATGPSAHAEGTETTASGGASHAEGGKTRALGAYSHAEGYDTEAYTERSHAQGTGTKALGMNSFATGTYNLYDTNTHYGQKSSYLSGDVVEYNGSYYVCQVANNGGQWDDSKWKKIPSDGPTALVVGNGMNDQNRSNALLVTWDGTGRYAGDVYANYNFSTNTGEKLATEAYVNEHGGGGGGSSDEYALKTDTVLETTLSRGRKADTTVGDRSFAFGNNVEASKSNTFAVGNATVASGTNAHAEGKESIASGDAAHAEGNNTKSTARGSHSEGSATQALGFASHAEGVGTKARGTESHAEGWKTTADGDESHAEGALTEVTGSWAHVQGYGTKAIANVTSASGIYNIVDEKWPDWSTIKDYVIGDKVTYDHEGYICKEDHSKSSKFQPSKWTKCFRNGDDAVIIGNGTSEDTRSNAAAIGWDGTGKYAGDVYANYDFATNTGEKLATESYVNEHGGGGGSSDEYALKTDTVLETTLSRGRKSDTTVGDRSFAFGNNVEASKADSFAVGRDTVASGLESAAFGRDSVASGMQGFAIGQHSEAKGAGSFAGGYYAATNGDFAHAEGSSTIAGGKSSHAEGGGTRANGDNSHAEGVSTSASGASAHSEGSGTQANGSYSHAGGFYTVANNYGQTAIGSYNIKDTEILDWTEGTSYSKGDVIKNKYGNIYKCIVNTSSTTWHSSEWQSIKYSGEYAVIVGNGTSESTRSNAAAIGWDGTGKYAGDVYANYDFSTNTGEKLATEAYVKKHGGGEIDLSAYATKEDLNTKANKSDLNSYATTAALDKKADKADTVLDTTLSRGRKSGPQTGTGSIAFGNDVTASAGYSVAFGKSTTASGYESFAIGDTTEARGSNSVAEGYHTIALDNAHAEGQQSRAAGNHSHAEGNQSTARGKGSHAEGYSTKANGNYQHVSGVYNIEDTVPQTIWAEGTAYLKNDIVKYTDGDYYICVVDTSSTTWKPLEWKILIHTGEHAVIVGNGSDEKRSNAAAITWDGTGKFAGDVYANYNFATKTGEKLATESFVRELIQQYLGS